MNVNPFVPQSTGTVSITSGAASANVALGNKSSSNACRVYNSDATNYAYIEFGGSTVVATAPAGSTPGSMAIGPGQVIFVGIPSGAVFAAALQHTAASTIFFTPGIGSGT